MNGSYYKNAMYNADFDHIRPADNFGGDDLPMEQSYIENILRLNKGKKVKAYFTYPDANEWRDKVYEGIIEEAGRDHLIMSDPKTGDWYLLRMIYLDYVTFEERINYSHDYSDKTF